MDTDRKYITIYTVRQTQIKAVCPSNKGMLGFRILVVGSEHFACSPPGRVVKEYKSIASFQNGSSDIVDVRKFYQGCGHTVHNGSLYFHIAGTSSIAR